MGYNKFITRDNQTLLDLTGDDLTNDTSKVLNGYKYHGRDGVQYTGTGTGGGTQPTLFAPVVTGGTNEVSWANDTRNGGFNVTITADVNGTPVTSPLTITQEMDGQTLTITASATNFNDSVTTITLAHVSGDTSVLAGQRNVVSYLYRSSNYENEIKWYYNGTEIPRGNPYELVDTFAVGNDTKTLDFYGVAISNSSAGGRRGREILSRAFDSTLVEVTAGTVAKLNGTITIFNKTQNTSIVLEFDNGWISTNDPNLSYSANDIITIYFNASIDSPV